MQNAYLHYVWSVWLVASLEASTSWSFPIACIALVWRTREKGTEFFCTTRRTNYLKLLSFVFLSLGALIAYCNQSHSHSCNQDNQMGNHSCCSHHNDDDSCAVRSHSSGWMGGSNVGSLDSSYRPGLETSEFYVTEYIHFEQPENITNTWLTRSALPISTVSILFLLVDLLRLSFLDFTLRHMIIYFI